MSETKDALLLVYKSLRSNAHPLDTIRKLDELEFLVDRQEMLYIRHVAAAREAGRNLGLEAAAVLVSELAFEPTGTQTVSFVEAARLIRKQIIKID